MTMRTKTTLFPKILRPECGAEATTFLSAVHNQRYTSEKLARRSKQSGRSMIEMLGVLAIIGVLTVGSIAGYSHAMRRHLLNKQREQISYILSAVETHREILFTSPKSTAASSLKPILETLGWIPEEMIKDNSIYIYDVFKNKIRIYNHESFMGLEISVANDDPHEQCVNLYQVTQQYHSFLWLTQVYNRANINSPSYVNHYFGDKYCGGNYRCIRDLQPAKISELCRVCDEVDRCILYILWK